jgi:hypothetical protein
MRCGIGMRLVVLAVSAFLPVLSGSARGEAETGEARPLRRRTMKRTVVLSVVVVLLGLLPACGRREGRRPCLRRGRRGSIWPFGSFRPRRKTP